MEQNAEFVIAGQAGPLTVVIANAVTAAFAIASALFWLTARRQRDFAWIAILGAAWFVDGLRYWFAATAGPMTAAAQLLPVLALAAYGASLFGVWPFAGPLRRPPLPDAVVAGGCALLAILAAIRDAARSTWEAGLGPDIDLVPFAGLLVIVALGFAAIRRLLSSLGIAESLNLQLEDRVRAATAGLAASEAARRTLEVSSAIIAERERLMREIHDGIGSSLVTTIASSGRRAAADSTAVLKRALTDLRIAVDSLEPVQGDIATLLASLRYRVEPDFRQAGIGFNWCVEEVPPVAWLDATNNLHVLRIFQEALGNIAAHSGASEVTVICRAEPSDGQDGVLIEVSDNGVGFDRPPDERGRGMDNMQARAQALGAKIDIRGRPGGGATVALWLALRRGEDADYF